MRDTRFAAIGRWPAMLLLAACAWLMAVGLAAPAPPALHMAATEEGGDAALYRAIVARTARDGYYAAAVAEHHARGYPLRPFVTVREPTLATLSAALGPAATLALYRLLVLVGLGALALRLRALPEPHERILGPAIALSAGSLLLQPGLVVWHEAWAAALIALAMAARPGRFWPVAVAAALAAALFRELAAPVMVAMAALSVVEKRRVEAAAWIAALALLAAALAAHAAAVASVTSPADLASPGWTRFGGWMFLLDMAEKASMMALLPLRLVAMLLPLALIGWAARGTRTTDGVTLVLAAILLPFAAIGRPENVYWGLLVGPLLPVGLAMAPAAFRDLLRAARQASPAPSSGASWTASASS